MARAKKTNKNIVRVDFTGVEGKRSILPDDDYLVEVEACEIKEGQAAPYFDLTMVVQAGDHKGSKLWDRASTSEAALWRLRSLLEVMGIEVPDGPLEIDPDELVGCTFVAVTAQESYQGSDGQKIAVRMVDFYPPGEDLTDEDDDEEEEKPKKVSKKPIDKKSKAKAGVAADDVMEADEDELQEFIDDHGLDVDLGDFKTLRKKRAAVIDALEEEGLIEE